MTVNGEQVRVGLAGVGRSGWLIHGPALARLPDRYRIVAVADTDAERLFEAEKRFAVRAYRDVARLFADPAIDLVVVATPNRFHTDHAVDALEAGKHVVVEKPVATSVVDIDRMIEASRRSGRLFAPFQNRRYDPYFQELCRIIDSGELGRIVQVRMALHDFTRRWDWQTLTEFDGGSLHNAGSHFLDQLLRLFGDAEPQVFCHMDHVLTLGDAEDHVVVMLRAPGRPLVQLEISNACAKAQDLLLVMGSRGTLSGGMKRLEWQTADLDGLPPVRPHAGPAEGRKYMRDQVVWRHHDWTVPSDEAAVDYTHRRFYEDLYATLRGRAPLVVTPQSIRRQIVVMEKARQSAGELAGHREVARMLAFVQ